MLQKFSGRDYLKIDIANSFGLDKKSWDDRIDWFDENESNLYQLVPQAEEAALFYAGITAWDKAKTDQPSGYPISLDATCSGIQILAALACDRRAAQLCNVVDIGIREDAYTSIYNTMVYKLGSSAKIDRKLTKMAIMHAFYGSTASPKRVFGEGKLLDLFYETVQQEAPGAWEINQTMLAIWDPTTLMNEWVLPDNFHVKIKVMNQVQTVVHFINEPYEIFYEVNMPMKGGRSLGANMVHSIDGMIVREMLRRCHYNVIHIGKLKRIAEVGGGGRSMRRDQDVLVQKLWNHYRKTNFLSARILDYLDVDNMGLVNSIVIGNLIKSLPEKSFQIISIHDCFRCLPNHGNDLRQQYNNLLAEIAESDLLGSLITQITGRNIQVNKLDPGITVDIRHTNYALS